MNEQIHKRMGIVESGPLVAVLMATYQGCEFVAEQINSIIKQTYSNWLIIISDDGSDDGTLEIAESFTNDERIIILERDTGTQGVVKNYSKLLAWALSNSTAAVFMFCDQDDVWLSDKIEVSVTNLQSAEAEVGAGVPVLVHGDMEVVDAGLERISNSYATYQGLKVYSPPRIEKLLVQNTVSGCAAAYNRALAVLASPIPDDAVWHDWWIALLAACVGKTYYLSRPLVKYRQTGTNAVGATRYSILREYALFSSCKRTDTVTSFLLSAERQAGSLLLRVNERDADVPYKIIDAVQGFSEFYSCSVYKRISIWFEHKYGRAGILGPLKFIVRSMAVPIHQ